MKRIIKKVLVILFGFPIGVILFLIVALAATLLLPIYAIGKGIEYIISLFKHNYESKILETFLEFIFMLYGFSSIFLLLPMLELEQNNMN